MINKYELSNHLGNVMVTVSDKRLGQDDDGNGMADFYFADVTSATDYYPFGKEMPGRQFSPNSYRFSFNGKEDDTEWGNGLQDYGFRIYSKDLGKFLSVDPLFKNYSFYTPYQFAGNTPIVAIDLDGLEIYYYGDAFQEAYTKMTLKVIDYFIVQSFKLGFDQQLPKKFIDHYAYGNGKTYTMNEGEMVQSHVRPVGLKSPLIRDQVAAQTSGMQPGETRNIKVRVSNGGASTSGTLGQFTISIEGNFTMGTNGEWEFNGTMDFYDEWDFNVETPEEEQERLNETGITRTQSGKEQTELAAKVLPGEGFEIKSEKVNVSQKSTDQNLDWFDGKSSKSLPNRATKVKYELNTGNDVP